MKRSASFLAGLFVIIFAFASTDATAASSRETLSKEALNISTWATAGLDEIVPPDIRRNLTFLREDLLDEAKSAPQGSEVSYKLGCDLCNALLATLEEHDRASVRAGYRAAQANNNTKITSPDLEIRGSVLYRWPQYAREQNQRSEIERQQNNQVALAREQVRVEWADRAAMYRRNLDYMYKRFREAMRQDPSFQKPNTPVIPKPGPVETSTVTPTPTPNASATKDWIKADSNEMGRKGKGKKKGKAVSQGQLTPPVETPTLQVPPDVQELFTPTFAALPAKERFERVKAKLKDLNPEFTSRFNHIKEEGGEVTELEFEGMGLKNLWPLRALEHLQVLKFGCPGDARPSVSDLSPLRGLQLRVLDCSRSRVSDLSPLAGMPLQKMWCIGTPVSDLSPLRGMKLTLLDCGGSRVQDLSPLAGMPLQGFHCWNTQVSDLSPLRGMQLTEFSCAGTRVQDLSLIAGMPLQKLWCERTQVSDLSPVRGMKLTLLWCGRTRVQDLSPLAGMPLQRLWCDNTQVADLSPLAGMPLQELGCWDTPVSELAPLRGMPLTWLNCGATKVKDLSPLAGMPLQQFWCCRTPVSDLSPLRGMKLTFLDCGGTRVHDLSPLADMPLEKLLCWGTQVSDLAPLRGMKLTFLDCNNTQVGDLSPLRGMKLTGLHCSNPQVSDLSPLRGMQLTELGFSSARVQDLSALAGMPLEKMWCIGTPVSDLSPLRGMKLTLLDCGGTRVHDLSPLAGMPLERVWCWGTQVSDLAPLRGMKLTGLNCEGTRVHDLSPLVGMPLQEIYLGDTPVSDLSPLRGMKLTELRCDFQPERDGTILHSIKTLEKINGQPATEFWKGRSAVIVSPDAQGRYKLDANNVELYGNPIRVESQGIHTCICWWDNPKDWALWKVQFIKPGNYELNLNLATIHDGVEFVVEVAGQTLTGKARNTGDWWKFQDCRPGRFEIKSNGVQQLTVRAKDAANWKAINIRDIQLRPVE